MEVKAGGHALVIPRGSVIVDGTIGSTEWAPALQLPLAVPIVGSTPLPVDLRVLQDGENLYASVRVPRTDVTVVLGVDYDNNRNGVKDSGEDEVFASTAGAVADGVSIDCESSHGCGRQNDQALGGTLDVTASWGTTTNVTALELSHPLASGDSYDIAVGKNGKFAAYLFVSLIGAGNQFLGVAYYPGPTAVDHGAFRAAHH
jgi:hypothetical protein